MKFAILAAALLLTGAGSAPAPQAGAPPSASEGFDPMNVHRERPGCVPVARQVAEPRGRENRAQRLDRLPPGRALLAVDRQVNGCREVTLLSEERRRPIK